MTFNLGSLISCARATPLLSSVVSPAVVLRGRRDWLQLMYRVTKFASEGKKRGRKKKRERGGKKMRGRDDRVDTFVSSATGFLIKMQRAGPTRLLIVVLKYRVRRGLQFPGINEEGNLFFSKSVLEMRCLYLESFIYRSDVHKCRLF